MKLRNKKTGEIGEIGYIGSSSGELTVSPINRVACESVASYNSLAELNEEWEDVPEEPKEYWYIENNGDIDKETYDGDAYEEKMIEIGNYFETKKEAEKAVEKIKSFSNLKKHEFMFDGWYYSAGGDIVILANAHEFNDMEEQDLTKVFGEKIC